MELTAKLFVAVAGAVAPALWLLWFLYRRRPGVGPRKRAVLVLYAVCFLTVIPAIVLEALLFVGRRVWEPPVLVQLLAGSAAIGLIEEGVKFGFFRWRWYNRPGASVVYDGVLAGAVVALGFATVENIGYTVGGMVASWSAGLVLIVARAAGAVPAHTAWGVVMGWYAGRARLIPAVAQRRRLLWQALLVPAAGHAVHDFFALASVFRLGGDRFLGYWGTVALGVIVLEWVVLVRLSGRARDVSRFTAPQPVTVRSGIPAWAMVMPRLVPAGPARFCAQCGRPTLHGDVLCPGCGAAWARPWRS